MASTKTKSSTRKTTARSSAKRTTAPKSPIEQTQALVDKVGDGWRVDHAQPAEAIDAVGAGKAAATVITVKASEYRAWKRNPNGTNLIEVIGDTPQQLADRIADWERSQHPVEPTQPTEEQIMNSAKATLHMAVTAAARQAVDVDVTPAAKKPAGKARRLKSNPPVEEVKLEKADQTLAGQQPASTGVGTGTGEQAPGATP